MDRSRRTHLLAADGPDNQRLISFFLRKAGAKHLIVAVPTGHDQPLMEFAQQVEAIYCPNIRREQTFAVAEAYENWRDLDELTTANILKEFYNSVKNKGSKS